MANLFYHKRFATKAMPLQLIEKVKCVFGDLNLFKESKVMHSSSTILRDGNLFQIKINEQSPKIDEDFFGVHFLRTYSDCILTTDMIIREEPKAFDVSPLTSMHVSSFNLVIVITNVLAIRRRILRERS